MSKFLELAENIEADLKAMDVDADELNAIRLVNKEKARLVFNDHHATQKRVGAGLDRMAQAIKDLSGSNSKGDDTEKKDETEQAEGSGGTSTTFPAS